MINSPISSFSNYHFVNFFSSHYNFFPVASKPIITMAAAVIYGASMAGARKIIYRKWLALISNAGYYYAELVD